MPARNESGFSLLEVVVALAVFSLGALATLNVLGESGRNATVDEQRMVAGIVAENRIAELMAQTRPPAPGSSRGVERAMGRDWEWEQVVAASPEPRILRIDVKVREAGRTQVISEISSFRAAAR
jgi:general secretion pathway protein I